jgi:O-antigen/teichoic acid export membrane protein
MENLRDKTLSGIRWTGIGQIIEQISYFIVNAILARLLSPNDFGLISMIMVFIGFAQIFSEFGLGDAIIQKKDLKQEHLNSVFIANIVVGIFITFIIILIAPLIATFYNERSLKLLIIVISINLILESIKIVQYALFQKKMDFKRLIQIEIISGIASGFISICMALGGMGVWSLVYRLLMQTAFSTIMLWIFSEWRPVLCWSRISFNELLGFSSNLFGFKLVNYWSRNIDNLLVGKFLSSSALGIYSRAYSLMMLPISQISSVVYRVMFPALSKIQNDIKHVKEVYLHSTRLIALVTFPLMVGLFIVSKPFIITIYTEKWSEVIPILQIFCFTGLVQSIGTTVGWIYTSQGRTDIMFKWGIFSGIIRLITFIIGLKWGITGVAIAYVLTDHLILWYPGWTISGRLINLSFYEMLRNLFAPFLCSLIMGLFTWAFGILFLSETLSWVHLIAQIIFGVIIYILILIVFRKNDCIEIKELFIK